MGHKDDAIDAMTLLTNVIPDQQSVQPVNKILLGGRGSGKSLMSMPGHVHTHAKTISGSWSYTNPIQDLRKYLISEIDRFDKLIDPPRDKPDGEELMLYQSFKLCYMLTLEKLDKLDGSDM